MAKSTSLIQGDLTYISWFTDFSYFRWPDLHFMVHRLQLFWMIWLAWHDSLTSVILDDLTYIAWFTDFNILDDLTYTSWFTDFSYFRYQFDINIDSKSLWHICALQDNTSECVLILYTSLFGCWYYQEVVPCPLLKGRNLI